MYHNEVIEADQKKIKPLSIGLLGNPNCGKSSIFNQLTGLRQKVGNFPGVTVDKKIGKWKLDKDLEVTLVDFPGAYSLYPNSQDERIVVQTFANPEDSNYPDAIIYIADITRLEKHLLLFTQIRDLGLPVILALNMLDVARKEGLLLDVDRLSRRLKVPVIAISGRTGEGLDHLKEEVKKLQDSIPQYKAPKPFYPLNAAEERLTKKLGDDFPLTSPFQRLLISHHYQWLPFLSEEQKKEIGTFLQAEQFQSIPHQVEETMYRFDQFSPLLEAAIKKQKAGSDHLTEVLDKVLTNRVSGPLIFILLMVMVFQAIYAWATVPMDLIEAAFGWLGAQVQATLPAGWFTDLLTDGILAGLGGIMVFIPQIAILFFLISLLEEVGYMARAAYMFDRLMQLFGLNGRSMVALISAGACAIPAVMSTRTIGNWKERMITIMVSPLISCSARIPVYTVLIGFVVPSATVWGIFNLQGLAFMGLYLLGIVAALGAALVFKLILRTRESSFLMLELPEYRAPVMRNIGLNVWEKVKTFVVEAGKVILIISIVLWVMASYGPPGEMAAAESSALVDAQEQQLDDTETANLVASRQIEASFAGHLGKFIEPAIEPLGFDWKMGIALITSFAAREVFVGTMATIYSIGSEEDELSIRERMAQEKDPITGEPVYSLATALSLLIFYVFAMQCMSTLAVVYRETKSWKWPAIQFTFMTALAYLGSLLVYQLFQ